MQSGSEKISSRSLRYKSRQSKRELFPPVPLTPDDTSDESKPLIPADTPHNNDNSLVRQLRGSNRFTHQRSKKRETARSPAPPSQQSKTKKRKKEMKGDSQLPVTDLKRPEQPKPQQQSDHGEIPSDVVEWVCAFGKLSNSKQYLALSKLIPSFQSVLIQKTLDLIQPQLSRDFIAHLPRELALHVLSYLSPDDLLVASLTSKHWHELCSDLLLWKSKCSHIYSQQFIIQSNAFARISSIHKSSNVSSIPNQYKQSFIAKSIILNSWRSSESPTKILKGHDDSVITCLQVRGDLMVSGSDDNTLKLWSIPLLKCLFTLNGHTGGVWCSEFDGSIVVSGSTDRNLRVWEVENGECLHVLEGHTSTVRCVSLHGDIVVSGSRDSSIRIWNVKTGECEHVLNGHTAAVRCVKYNGEFVVSGGYDWTVKVWSPLTAQCLHTLQGHANRVYSLEFDGEHIISGSLDTIIKVWDVRKGSLLHDLVGHRSLTSSMSLRDKVLVSGNADSTVKIWDTDKGEFKLGLQGKDMHKSAVTCVQLVHPFVVTSSDDGTVKLWELATGEFIRNLIQLKSQGSGGVVWRIHADEKRLVAAVGSRHGTEETRLVILDFDI